jgi:hypothetical protein
MAQGTLEKLESKAENLALEKDAEQKTNYQVYPDLEQKVQNNFFLFRLLRQISFKSDLPLLCGKFPS